MKSTLPLSGSVRMTRDEACAITSAAIIALRHEDAPPEVRAPLASVPDKLNATFQFGFYEKDDDA